MIKGGYTEKCPFDIMDGWKQSSEYPALWKINSNSQTSIINPPNAQLIPTKKMQVSEIWNQSGYLHVTPDIRYSAQRIHATITSILALGITSWHTLQIKDDEETKRYSREIALVLWLNSTFGLICHAHYASRSQRGRGRGSLTMLTTLPTLDVRLLDNEQLESAVDIFQELSSTEFQPFYKLAIDANRIQLDNRLIQDVLRLDKDMTNKIDYIRAVLANEPSIYHTKEPALLKNDTTYLYAKRSS